MMQSPPIQNYNLKKRKLWTRFICGHKTLDKVVFMEEPMIIKIIYQNHICATVIPQYTQCITVEGSKSKNPEN